MAKLHVDSSTEEKVESGRDSIVFENHGTPDAIVARLLRNLEKNNSFYQKKIADKEAHIESQSHSLLEKNEIIKTLIKELSLVSKQNEEARYILVKKLETITDYIKEQTAVCSLCPNKKG